jgi:cholesterol oxidase
MAYRVGLLEPGRGCEPGDFPDTGKGHAQDALGAPKVGMTGTMRISTIGKATIVSSAAVGGGSIIYGKPCTSLSTISGPIRSAPASPTR